MQSCGTFVDDIRGLATLHDDGLLTDSEYAAAKRLAIAAAFPSPSPSSSNTTDGPYVTIDCGSSDRKKILTAVLPLKSSKPIDLRSQSICPGGHWQKVASPRPSCRSTYLNSPRPRWRQIDAQAMATTLRVLLFYCALTSDTAAAATPRVYITHSGGFTAGAADLILGRTPSNAPPYIYVTQGDNAARGTTVVPVLFDAIDSHYRVYSPSEANLFLAFVKLHERPMSLLPPEPAAKPGSSAASATICRMRQQALRHSHQSAPSCWRRSASTNGLLHHEGRVDPRGRRARP